MHGELIERLRGEQVLKQDPPTTLILDGKVITCGGGQIVKSRNPDGPEAADALETLSARIAQLEAERDGMREALRDPNAVHVNLLRGEIARPTVHQMIHIYSPAKVRHALENYARAALKEQPHAD
jgi:hypothetical protein